MIKIIKHKSKISYILLFTIVFLFFFNIHYENKAHADAFGMLLSPVGYNVAYAMAPYVGAGLLALGAAYLTYKVYDTLQVRSVINEWYQSLTSSEKSTFDNKVLEQESISSPSARKKVTIDRDFVISAGGAKLFTKLVTKSLGDLTFLEMSRLQDLYINSEWYGKTFEEVGASSDISSYKYRSLQVTNIGTGQLRGSFQYVFHNDIMTKRFYANFPRYEVNQLTGNIGYTTSAYSGYNISSNQAVEVNVPNNSISSDEILDISFPETIAKSPSITYYPDIVVPDTSISVDYGDTGVGIGEIDWENGGSISYIPPLVIGNGVISDLPLTDTIPWETDNPFEDTGTGGNTGVIESIINAIKSLIGSIVGLLTNIWDFLKSLFVLPNDITLDFSKFEGLDFFEKFPFSLPYDISQVFANPFNFLYEPDPEIFHFESTVYFMNTSYDLDININNIFDMSMVGLFSRYFTAILYIFILLVITRKFLF